jgi:hypothetical protein
VRLPQKIESLSEYVDRSGTSGGVGS